MNKILKEFYLDVLDIMAQIPHGRLSYIKWISRNTILWLISVAGISNILGWML